jgi:UDP:flavonoid glycosyltransferase YjiC (YdhE family)
MPDVTFFIWPEPGHVAPAASFARSLIGRGHRCRFAGFPDFEETFTSRGLEFVPIGERAIPRGSVEHALALVTSALSDSLAHFASDSPLGPEPPRFAVIDSIFPIAALAAVRAGSRVVMLGSGLPYSREGTLPPLTTGILPRGELSSLRAAIAWGARLASRAVLRRAFATAGRPDLLRTLRSAAVRARLPTDVVIPEAARGYGLRLPELVLCPIEFELPHRPPSHRRYVEPAATDPHRPQDGFPWGELRERAGLVLCAFGSQTHRYGARTLTRIFRGVLRTARAHPELDFVVAHGALDPARLGARPGNVVLARSVPQPALLSRARAFVTHGGLNSIKEAISASVPLLVFPMVNDQPGNAARVVFHGIGRRASTWASEVEVASQIDALLGDQTARARVEEMGRVFRRLDAETPGAAWLARVLDGDDDAYRELAR